MDENDQRFSNVDLGSLLEDLFGYAKWLFGQKKCGGDDPVLPGTGKSSKDLVKDALTEFILKRPDWHPSSPETAQAELFFLVRKMVKNDFLDLIKDGRAYKRTEIIGAKKVGRGEDVRSQDEPSDEDELLLGLVEGLNDEEIVRRAYSAAEGAPELEEYLGAVLRDGYTKPSKVAAHLGINLREATRRRDRLKTRLTPLMRALGTGRLSKSHRT
jgi:hypothetical protein